MLEAGQVLRTWRLEAPPQLGQAVRAEPSFDHRLLYLDYEGPISGARGSVRRWDGGVFEWLGEEPGRLVLRLDGVRLRGIAWLQEEAGEWRLTVEPLASG